MANMDAVRQAAQYHHQHHHHQRWLQLVSVGEGCGKEFSSLFLDLGLSLVGSSQSVDITFLR